MVSGKPDDKGAIVTNFHEHLNVRGRSSFARASRVTDGIEITT